MSDPLDPCLAPDLVLASVRQPGDEICFDVHLRGGAVSAIIPSRQDSPAVPAATRVVDLDGRYIIPGLWDEHVHMTQWALASNRLDLSAAGSAREAAAVVGSHLAETVAAESLVDGGGTGAAAALGLRDLSRRWWASVSATPSGRTCPAWRSSMA